MLRRPDRLGGRVLIGGLVTVALMVGTASTADAAAVTPQEKRIAKRLTARIASPTLGKHTGGVVLDAKSGRVIWGKRSTTGRMPGSVAKLVTALAAMDRLGPNYTVTTRITTGGSASQIVFVGAGDQLLTSKNLASLAATTANKLANAGIHSVSLKVDDSLFPAPTPAPGWKASYYPYDVSPVRALIVDQRAKFDTSLDAGQLLAGHLEQDGIVVTSVSRGRRPSSATTLASHTSLPMKAWLARMLLVSDADIAEGVSKLVTLKAGVPATWANGKLVRDAVLKKYNVKGSVLVDGSGLSRSDRMTPRGLARLLRVLHKRTALQSLITYLPVAGKTGTLARRFSTAPSSCAKGMISAKSGSLGDMIALAGIARNKTGRQRIFVFMESGERTNTAVKRSIDGLAATVTGCW